MQDVRFLPPDGVAWCQYLDAVPRIGEQVRMINGPSDGIWKVGNVTWMIGHEKLPYVIIGLEPWRDFDVS